MAQTAANLLDHVLPSTPLRQFVLTVPFELRQRLAYDGKLLSVVGRIFVDSVLGFYRRRMRAEGVTERPGRCRMESETKRLPQPQRLRAGPPRKSTPLRGYKDIERRLLCPPRCPRTVVTSVVSDAD